MEPDHDKIRSKEDPKTQDYWETGITTDTINVLKQGNMDHSQKTCYHCNRKGHIKANCPARKRLETKPNHTKPNQTKFPYIGHNSVVFQNRISKFCMELHLDNIHLPYHSKPNQTSPNHTKPNQISLIRP